MAGRSSPNSSDETVQQLDATSTDSREITIAESASRRVTVHAFHRVPKVYFPTLVIGIAVVFIATVMLAISVFGK